MLVRRGLCLFEGLLKKIVLLLYRVIFKNRANNNMNLTLEVNIEQLIERLKLLPASQLAGIMAELEKSIEVKTGKGNTDFQDFLLKGPVMSDDQYDVFIENRKNMNQWRNS
jgi:hypothetical protein